jgi:hypothetical protein
VGLLCTRIFGFFAARSVKIADSGVTASATDISHAGGPGGQLSNKMICRGISPVMKCKFVNQCDQVTEQKFKRAANGITSMSLRPAGTWQSFFFPLPAWQ